MKSYLGLIFKDDSRMKIVVEHEGTIEKAAKDLQDSLNKGAEIQIPGNPAFPFAYRTIKAEEIKTIVIIED